MGVEGMIVGWGPFVKDVLDALRHDLEHPEEPSIIQQWPEYARVKELIDADPSLSDMRDQLARPSRCGGAKLPDLPAGELPAGAVGVDRE